MMYAPEHLTEKRFEKYKAALRPTDWFPQMKSLDFESLAESDRVYLQDFGVFNSELEEETFMLRVRVPGGRVGAANFKVIADLAEKYDLTLLLTARSGIQIHGIEPENVLELFEKINALEGLSTWQTFGDNVRNVVTDPYDGRGKSCEIEAFPIIEALHARFHKHPDLVGMLPRRISIGITGMRENAWPLFANDLFFGLAEKEGMIGFNVYMGGKNTEISQSADIFLAADEVVDFAMAVIEAFNRHGPREKRMKSRLFHMIEHYGMAQVKELIAQIYAKPWRSAGVSLLRKRGFGDKEALRDGTWGHRYRTDYGLIGADEARRIADWVLAEGGELRIGIDQQLYLLGVGETPPPGARTQTSPTVVACAGSEYCPFSYWSIKEEAHLLPADLLTKYDIKVGFSGCLKGCGRHKHTDIGIVGLRNAKFGRDDRAARIFLGCEYTEGRRVAEAVFRSVPVASMADVVKLLVTVMQECGYEEFEAFAANVLNRFDERFLEFYFLARLESGARVPLDPTQGVEAIAAGFGRSGYVRTAAEEGWQRGSDALIAAMWHRQEAATVRHVDPSKRRSR